MGSVEKGTFLLNYLSIIFYEPLFFSYRQKKREGGNKFEISR